MKRLVFISLILSFSFIAFAGELSDGVYFAQEDSFSKSGWKYHVIITVENGEITDAIWNGTNINGGLDKVALSKAGQYPMVKSGGAKTDWHIQAKKVQDYLLETQDPEKIFYRDKDGHTDDISGASIHVKEFFILARKALDSEAIKRGHYLDGYFFAQEDSYDEKSGWKYFAQFTVVNGTIVQVNWNGLHKKGGDSKKVSSANGEYGMKTKGGAQEQWHIQAILTEEYFIMQKGKAPDFTDNYHTDAITGASIGVKPLWDLAEKALKQ